MRMNIATILISLLLTFTISGCGKTAAITEPIDASSAITSQEDTAVSESTAVPDSYMVTGENYFDYQPGLECSAFSSAYLLRHYGEEADGLTLYEDFPSRLPDGGAMPDGIEKFFNGRGYNAVFKSDGTVDILKELVSRGAPVIVFIHVEEPYETTHNTHYIPLIGYDADYLYFAESLTDYANCKDEKDVPYNRKIEIAKFERLWANIDGVWDYPYFEITNKALENQSQTSSALSVEAASGDAASSDNSNPLSYATIADIGEVIAALTALPSRIPGSVNNENAAQWIARQFELLKLTPLLKEDFFWSYKQTIDGQEALPKNVVGYIKGSDSARAVVISCHLDAVSGSAGAVDNASGVAAMLRTAANVLAYDKLNADIVFCAFNGEEQNYAGSKAFVEEFQGMYESVYNINFDCVGMIDGGSYMFGAEESDISYTLNKEMRTYLEKYKIPYGSYPVSGVRSDHISFENAKIPNINFTQIGIQSVIHSTSDQAGKLDVKQIDLLADCVSKLLIGEK